MKRALVLLSAAYLVLVVICLVTLLLLPSFHQARDVGAGCYLTNAMFPYAECRGFGASGAVALILNIPYVAVYLPVFGVAALKELQVYGLVPVMVGVLLWVPVVYLGWHVVRRGRA